MGILAYRVVVFLIATAVKDNSIVDVAIWLIGFLFEGVGDWQKSRFKADPANKGKVMQSGQWRYIRHWSYRKVLPVRRCNPA